MKKSIILFAVLTFALFVVPLAAQEAALPQNANKVVIEDNLFAGLANSNTGLQRSCALMLGKIKSDRAVIPLMTLFHDSPNENVRIAAAWALCKIGNSRGVYAVKMAVKYDEQAKVQATCAWYYENFVKQGSFTFTQPEEQMVASSE
jgi:HEAT repeat protein